MATYARYGGIFNNHFTANVPENLPVKKNLKIGYDLTELWPRVCGLTFFGPPCILLVWCRCVWSAVCFGVDVGGLLMPCNTTNNEVVYNVHTVRWRAKSVNVGGLLSCHSVDVGDPLSVREH